MLSFDFGNGSAREVIYLPSLAEISYKSIYSIEINKSGRLQYFYQPVNGRRKRITKTAFSTAYNHQSILGIRPVQSKEERVHFLLRFYTM